MKSEVQLVGASKVSAHLLPDYVMPIDREYTLYFLKGSTPMPTRELDWFLQVHSELVYKLLKDKAFTDFADTLIAKNMSTKYWNTSRVKVLDNVIIGKRVLEKFLVSTATRVNNIYRNFVRTRVYPNYNTTRRVVVGFPVMFWGMY